jgi:hypothetical protein
LTLKNSLDNLLFFNQESTHNTVSNTVSTTRSTIGSADGLLGLGDRGEFTRTKSLDLHSTSEFPALSVSSTTYTSQSFTTVTTTRSLHGLLLVVVNKIAAYKKLFNPHSPLSISLSPLTRGLYGLDTVRTSVVRTSTTVCESLSHSTDISKILLVSTLHLYSSIH